MIQVLCCICLLKQLVLWRQDGNGQSSSAEEEFRQHMNSILEEDVDPEESDYEREDSDVPVSGSDSDSDGPDIKIPANLFSPERCDSMHH